MRDLRDLGFTPQKGSPYSPTHGTTVTARPRPGHRIVRRAAHAAHASVSSVDSPLAAGQRLSHGKPVERVIAKGETHVYEIEVAPDRVVSGVVDQRGIDVEVRIFDPTGALRTKVDSPNGDLGPEPWSIDGQPPGRWRLEVIPYENQSGKGRYEARIDEVITRTESEERSAKQRYRSPRLLRLWERSAPRAPPLSIASRRRWKAMRR